MTSRTKKFLWSGGVALLLAGMAAGWWLYKFRAYTPAAVALDVRAAIAAKDTAWPAREFLERRYGPLTEPDNRQRAFLDFFDLGHMEGMYVIVSHMQGARRQTNIAGMAQWIAEYRRTLSADEKEKLSGYLSSEAGRARLAKATAQYLKKNVEYRSATAPVITELMTTLATVQKQ